MDDILLEVRGIRNGPSEPIDFELRRGECLALVGPSGSGKTLLLRALADLDPHHGRARLDGRDAKAFAAPEWRRRVTYVAAEPGWWAETAGEHFQDRPAALDLLPRLGLPQDILEAPIARLSTGERQRLALVRALLLSPQVFLLDEPTASLDEESTGRVETVLHERMGAGVGVVLATHDPTLAGRLALRRIVLGDGAPREAAS